MYGELKGEKRDGSHVQKGMGSRGREKIKHGGRTIPVS